MKTCKNMWSKKHLNRDLYKREKYLGSILNRFDWYPELLYSDDDQNLLIFRYAGIPLTPDNAPDDVCFQYDNIMKDMESLNINHNDIKNGELLINNGKIYLCDFGWGSINNNMNCGIDIWGCPNHLKPKGYLNDAMALQRLPNYFKKGTRKITNEPELHIVIDWTNYFTSLETFMTYSLHISKKIIIPKLENKSKTMGQFYSRTKGINDFRGETDFTLYLIQDLNPIYDFRKTSRGNRKVNIHIFDLKTKLRNITGGVKIHATDNIQETEQNLQALNISI